MRLLSRGLSGATAQCAAPSLCAALSLCAAAWLYAAAPASAAAPDPLLGTLVTPPESATVVHCHAAALQADRYATFAGAMAATAKTKQMAMRFTLLERLSNDFELHPASAPSLGVWQKSAPGVAVFRYSQEVTNLPSPGSFRALISFRWYDAHHRVIKHGSHMTPLCAMPDERPHLRVGAIVRRPIPESQSAQYDVTVHNEGLGPAVGVGVALAIDGVEQPLRTIDQLPGGGQQTVTFTGPRCGPTGSLTVTLDPAGTVAQTTRTDDVKTIACA